MKKSVYTKEMNRRLFRLYKCLSVYFQTGRDTGVTPALFSVFSYCWCRIPRKVIASSEFNPLEDCLGPFDEIVPSPGVKYVAGDNIDSDDLPF